MTKLLTDLKKCSSCKSHLEHSMFCNNRSKSDGLHAECRECQITYRKENRERLRKEHKEEYYRNRSSYSNYFSRPEVKEQRKQYMKTWRTENKDKIDKDKRTWAKANRDKMNRYKRKRRDGRGLTEKEELILFERFKNQCFNCNTDNNLQIDHHIPFSKGRVLTLDNATILCKYCNGHKTDKDPEEFYSAYHSRSTSYASCQERLTLDCPTPPEHSA